MNKFKNFLIDAIDVKQEALSLLKGFRLALPMAIIGLMVTGATQAQELVQTQDDALKVKVFQAAGPNGDSIRSTITEFQNTLGANNGITTVPPVTPLTTGRREINWDGGSTANTTTTLTQTPVLDQFLSGRGARFTTPGTGFVQATPAGLAAPDVFANPSYATIFKAFSLQRLFSPIGSNVHDTLFFVPGHGDEQPATTRGFGAVFSDIDLPDGSGPGEKEGNRHASTLIEFYGANGDLLFSSFVPAAPGDGNLSFFGIVLDDARIARVRIIAGVTPGVDDTRRVDVVMMDDFIYGEPQRIIQ